MNDDELRRVARAAHDDATGTIDSLVDLALVHRRIARGEIGEPVQEAGHDPVVRGLRWTLPAAAAVIAIAVAGLVVVGTRDGGDSVRTLDTNVGTSAPAVIPPTIPTAPSNALATTTEVVEPPVPATVSVDAATPPPLVVPEPLVAIPLASNPDSNLISVAIGPTSIAVRQPATDVVTLIDYGSGFDAAAGVREVGIDEPLHSIALGPGDVLYGFGDTVIPASGGAPDAFRFVAMALSGDKTGQVVAESDLSPVRYLELPPGTFGHGPDGIIDRDRNVNTTVIGYADVDGNPIEWSGPAPTLLTFETDLEDGGRVSVVGSDLAWDLAITKSPDSGGSFVGPSPPAPTSDGRVIYSDTIGRDLTPDQDFGPSAIPVVAVLEPDGTGQWIRLPDDWSVAASDIWGTVLMRTTSDSIELALLDDVLDAASRGSAPESSEPPVAAGGGPDVDAFVDAVTDRSFVLLPDALDAALDRPYIAFQNPNDPELPIEGHSGCTSFFGRGTWAAAGDGLVTLDGTLTVGTAGCSPGDDTLVMSGTVRFMTQDDELIVIGDDTTWTLVAIDAIPIPSLEQLAMRWSAGNEGELTIDPTRSLLRLAGCSTTIDVKEALITTTGWANPDCDGTELSLTRALDHSDIAQPVNQLHLAGDVLILESRSAKRRPIVFALPASGPLLDPTSVSVEPGSAN